ncbi:MAG: T9SS type A sorting domain-containing protein [Mariniphaga sp.]
MKNRLVQSGLMTAFTGILILFFSVLLMAGQPGNPELRKNEGVRMKSIRANQNTQQINPSDVMKAREQAESLRTKSTASAMNLNWLSAGPDNYPGLSWATIFDNTDPTGNTLITGGASGGIWKSIDLGLTWLQLPVENNTVPRVSSMIQTANGTIYAATGVTTCKSIKLYGNGIYSSVNGSPFAAIASTQNNPDFNGVTKIACAPGNGRLYAATIGGLYVSENGSDWTKKKSGYAMDVVVGPDGTVITAVGDSAYIALAGNLDSWVTLTTGQPNALPKTGIGWMVFAIAPSNVNIMYASLAGTDGKLLNIYTSIDKGLTWTFIFPKNPTFEPYYGLGCYSNTLAVSPNDPDQLYLGGINMWHGKRIQENGFFNWEEVSSGIYSPWFSNNVPAYHHSYVFSEKNPQKMAISSDGGITIGTVGADTITFKTINKMLSTSQFNSVSFSAQRSYVMGGGDRIGTLALGYFYPTQPSYPIGVNSSTEGLPVWLPDGLVLGYDGGSCEWSNIDSKIAVFTAHQGTPSMRRRDFTDLTYDNDFNFGVHPVDSSYIPMRLWESFNFAQTRDSVKYYARIETIPADTTLMIESANNKFLFPYLTTAPIPKGDSIMVADPIASRYFFYGTRLNVRGIYMTKDMLKFNKDPQYFIVYKDTAKVDIITALAVSADLNTAWAGTKLGRLIRITGLIHANDTSSANITNPACQLVDSIFAYPALKNRMVTSISINPANTSQVLVTLGNYGNQDFVYYTSNGSAPIPSFTSVQGNLPKAPVYSSLIELHGNNAILGTDFGVFTTTNLNSGAPQWAADMQNIGDVAVTDIRQQVIHDYHILNYGVIYLASYGRGLWMDTTYYAPVGIEPVHGQPTASGALKLAPNPVKNIVNITYSHTVSGELNACVYDLSGRIVLSRDFGNQPIGTFNGNLNLGTLPLGTYIIKVGNGYGKIVKL